MKPEIIEAWAVYRNGEIMEYFEFKQEAEADVFHHGGTVIRLTGEMPRVPNVEDDFVKVTVDGVDYYDSKKELPHQDAINLAAKHGLRVLKRWELCKLFDEGKEFRESLDHKWIWSASVFSSIRNYAWKFYGSVGSVSYSSRDNSYGVRCVGGG